jgi:hypothetical protein
MAISFRDRKCVINRSYNYVYLLNRFLPPFLTVRTFEDRGDLEVKHHPIGRTGHRSESAAASKAVNRETNR